MCTIRSKSKVVFWPLRQNCFPLPCLVRHYQLQRYLHRLSLNIKNSNKRQVVWTKLDTIIAQIEICLSEKTFAQYCGSVQPGRGDCDCERTGKGANHENNSLEFIHDQLFRYFDSTGQWRWVATEQKGKKEKNPTLFPDMETIFTYLQLPLLLRKKFLGTPCWKQVHLWLILLLPIFSFSFYYFTRSMWSGNCFFFQVWGVLALINMRVTHSKWRYVFKKPHGAT